MTTAITSGEVSAIDVSWPTLEQLVALARRGGQAILACASAAPAIKADGSPVTNADRAAHAIICAGLTAWDPTTPIVSEEATLPAAEARAGWRRYWLVDPLDGTKEYLAGRADFTVNIARIDDGEPVMGVVYAPVLDVVYWAARGLGSWRQEGSQPPVRLRVHPPVSNAGVRIVESRSHPSPEMERFVREVHVVARTPLGSSLKVAPSM